MEMERPSTFQKVRALAKWPLLLLAVGGIEEGLDRFKAQPANPFEGVTYSALGRITEETPLVKAEKVKCHLENSPDFKATTPAGSSVEKRAEEWTNTIYNALNQLGIPATQKNLEYTLILMHRESRMDTNPQMDVSQAYERKEKEVLKKVREKLPQGAIQETVTQEVEALFDKYKKRINAAQTEEEVEDVLSDIHDDFEVPAKIGEWLIPYDPWDEKIAHLQSGMKVNTLGVLQVNTEVAKKYYAAHGKILDDIAAEDYLFHLLPNLKVGLAIFFTSMEKYLEMGIAEKDAVKFAFADYNGGIYSSRNAAFQQMLAELTGTNLTTDGDLLLYEHDGVSDTRSETEQAVQKLFPDQNVREDLLHEKASDFDATTIYKNVVKDYKRRHDDKAELALIPDAEDPNGEEKYGQSFTAQTYVDQSMKQVQAFKWRTCK